MKLVLTFLTYTLILTSAVGQYVVHKLPYPVNTDVYDEICPVLSFEEDELYFTRSRSLDYNTTLIENGINLYNTLSKEAYAKRLQQIYSEIAESNVEDPVNSTFNQDVYVSKFSGGEVFNYVHPDYPLNNALPNSVCAPYGNNASYVVINEFDELGGMNIGFSYVHKRGADQYSFPQPILIRDFELYGSEINLAISEDKNYIILSMEEPNSDSGKDLYYASKVIPNVYSRPVKMENVNTKYDETTPFFSRDSKTLYFASNRPGGYGGLDIYSVQRLRYTFDHWTAPDHLDHTINTDADESHPYLTEDSREILFTSNRDGSSDIYYGKVMNIEEMDYSIRVNVYAVKNGERSILPSEIQWGSAHEDKMDGYFRTNSGTMRYTFDDNQLVKMIASVRGKKSDLITLDPSKLESDGVKSIDIEIYYADEKKKEDDQEMPQKSKVVYKSKPKSLDPNYIPLDKKSTVLLKNIYFVKGKPEVLEKSLPAIRNLAKALKENPSVYIRIDGHTDNVGDKDDLMLLSELRAKEIAKILVKEGIQTDRIKTMGFGAFRPITKNRSEKERSQNRRVEITILDL